MCNIHKSFSGVQVLTDVSFDLEPGEVHILAGENGAGKTTLIKILAGVHTDYSGEIHLNGQKIRFLSPSHAVQNGISAIHQELSLVNSMTVEDNIFLGRELAHKGIWMDHLSQKEKARQILSQLKIDVDLSRPVQDYPLSMRQMFEIAKALVYESSIIIMDEPTSALNEQEVDQLFEIIAELKQQGRSIIYISHRMEEIFEIGDRITVLRDGQHVGTSKAEELTSELMIHWMVGREIEQQFPIRSQSIEQTCLEVRDLSLPHPTNPKLWAIQDVSFHVNAGEILGIAGLQGSGKSELLNGLFGTYGKVKQGAVSLDGKELDISSPRASIQEGLILLTNDRKSTGLIPEMNIIHNISLAALNSFSPLGIMNADKEKHVAQESIAELGIKIHSLEQEVMTLSGGNQQKVALAKCLETKPKVLLLDEPTIGVDVGAKHDIYALMNLWSNQGIAILLVTSELPELLAMSDRILVLHRGVVTATFDQDEASPEKIIQAAMGGKKVA